MAINDIRLSVIAQPASLPRRGWLAELPAQPGPAAIGLVWPAAPAPEAVAAMAGAVLLDSRTGYLDPRPALLPWHSVAANLVLGTGLDPTAPLAGRMLAAMGLAPLAARRPAALAPFERLVLGLGRAMLHHPGLLVVAGLAGHPAAAGQLRALAGIEAELGQLTGCRRLHLVARAAEAEAFCDLCLFTDP